MSNNAKHRIQLRVPVPRERRWVTTPIDGSGEKVLSDVFPVQVITPSYPIIGTTTWEELNYKNDPDPDHFSDYVLRHIVPDATDGFMRGYFSRNIPAEDAAVPFETTTKFDDHPWYPILKEIKFYPDRSMPRITRDEDGRLIVGYRLYPKEWYIPGASEGTLFTIKRYVGSSPFNITQTEVPQPASVTYVFDGVERTFERCLFSNLKIKPQRGGFAAFDETTSTTTTINGFIPGQDFGSTNVGGWEEYKIYDDQQKVEFSLYERKEIFVAPPEEPELRFR